MSRINTERYVYLNGQDTGLKSSSPSLAAFALHRVLRRRGALYVTQDQLMATMTVTTRGYEFTRKDRP